jgi:hypothetical protein
MESYGLIRKKPSEHIRFDLITIEEILHDYTRKQGAKLKTRSIKHNQESIQILDDAQFGLDKV